MNSHYALRGLAWAVSVTSLFVLTLGAVLISLVVGLWVRDHTGNEALSWLVGLIVVAGFLATLGIGIGIWLWLHVPLRAEDPDTMNQILIDMQERVPKD